MSKFKQNKVHFPFKKDIAHKVPQLLLAAKPFIPSTSQIKLLQGSWLH